MSDCEEIVDVNEREGREEDHCSSKNPQVGKKTILCSKDNSSVVNEEKNDFEGENKVTQTKIDRQTLQSDIDNDLPTCDNNVVESCEDINHLNYNCSDDVMNKGNDVKNHDETSGRESSYDGRHINDDEINDNIENSINNDVGTHDNFDSIENSDEDFESDADESRPILNNNDTSSGNVDDRRNIIRLAYLPRTGLFKNIAFLKKSKANYIEIVTILLTINWILVSILRHQLSSQRITWQTLFYLIGNFAPWLSNTLYLSLYVTGLNEKTKDKVISIVVFIACFLSSIVILIATTSILVDVVYDIDGLLYWKNHDHFNMVWSVIAFGYLVLIGLLFQTKIHFLEFQYDI